ncbi:MAG: hypothetical protein JWQ16_3296 [Novosphingobium sp.]|jgi:hypothetical protein|nr:hypothetical protein [Novosphingobium sp.]
MSQTLDLYLARADEAATEARQATLDNVRDRCLRSEAAWRDMADRQTRIERLRQEKIASGESV